MAGIDLPNQFPNSMMANAVRLGQSQFRSVDTPSTPISSQNNVDITTAKALTVPNYTNSYGTYPAAYAVIMAIGGTLYYTLDGTTPSATNYAGSLAAGASVPFTGSALKALKVFGTTMSVQYLR